MVGDQEKVSMDNLNIINNIPFKDTFYIEYKRENQPVFISVLVS